MILGRTERMVARRYLLPGRGEAFIFLVASISLGAVALGVAALIVVMSVMNGFRAELFDKSTGLNGHAVVQGYAGQLRDWRKVVEQAKATPGVTSATPLIEQPLFASFNGRVEFAQIRGLRTEDIRTNPALKGKEIVGSLNRLKPGGEQVAIGSRLAEALGADKIIDMRELKTPDDRAARVKELTKGWGADVVVDVAGFPAVVAEGDYVTVMTVRHLQDAKKNPYTTTWFDTWRFVDGKADEHWDPATLPAGQ